MMSSRAGPAVFLLIAVAGCGGSSPAGPGGASLPTGTVALRIAPIDLSGASWFFPMGGPNVLPGDHGGFDLTEAYVFPAATAVLAPADGIVVEVSHGRRAVPSIPDAPPSVWGREYDDHLLRLRVSTTVTVNFGHLTDWHPAFEAKLPSIPVDERGHRVSVPVRAGDTLAFVGPHGAMDFSITDRGLEPSILNPSRYPDGYIYSGNIFDYFEEPARSRMLAIAARELPPRGGKLDYDVAGTISGNWFLEGTTSFIQWSRQLAIVYDHVWGARITISDGSPMRDVPGIEGPGAPNVWWVRGNSPLPETVGVTEGVVSYQLIYGPDPSRPLEGASFDDSVAPIQGVMLVRMIEAGRIQVEIFEGVTTAPGFTSAAKVYVR